MQEIGKFIVFLGQDSIREAIPVITAIGGALVVVLRFIFKVIYAQNMNEIDKVFMNRKQRTNLKLMDLFMVEMEELKFSENTPVLYFLSENNLEMFSTWKKIHEDLIQEKERSKIVPLSGNHYVYYKHGAEIAKTVTDWILND